MRNTNYLINMRCPNCGSEGPFRIRAEATFLVYDDGTDEYEWVDWDEDSWCMCQNTDCEFGEIVREFMTEETPHA